MSTAQMEKHLFNLKFAAKQLNRDSKKAEKEEKAERAKLKKAMEKGNMEVARIHAENGKIFLEYNFFGHQNSKCRLFITQIRMTNDSPYILSKNTFK